MKIRDVFAVVFCCMLLIASCAAADGYSMAVIDAKNSTKLHLRAEPSAKSESFGLYFTGTQVEVTGDQQENFVPVRIGVVEGFMHADYLKTGDNAKNVAKEQPIGVATPKVGARLRSGPSTEWESLCVIDQGEVFTVLGETSSHWYYVEYEGQNGYVSTEVANLVDEIDGRPMAFGPVLLGEAAFEVRGGRKTIDELDDCFEMEAAIVPTSYTVLDMDSDGLKEVVVRAALDNDDFGFLVLDLQCELVYGYTFYLRAMQDLKQDGTFSFSSGAMDNGIGRMTFDGPVAEKTELARCRDTSDGEIVYAVNGESASQTEYEEFVRMQDAKQGVNWHAFTKAQIEERFTR